MNKKNFPLFLSVFIVSVFFTLIFYLAYVNIQDNYKLFRQHSFADANLDIHLNSSEIKELEKINGIKFAGGVWQQQDSALFGDTMLAISYQDQGMNQMSEYAKLIQGRFAETQNEIVLSKDIMEKYQLKLGQKITLNLGKRYLGKSYVSPIMTYTAQEEFAIKEEKSYEIVGVYGNVYNKYLNVSFGLTLPQEDVALAVYLRFDDFKVAYGNQEKLKLDLSKKIGKSVDIHFSDTMIKYYGINQMGINAHIPMIINIVGILCTIFLFVFFVQNIFRIWGLRKVRELSIYKSIGSTDFQIYGRLMKESILLSFLPIILGHTIGYFVVRFIYLKIQEIRMKDVIEGLPFSFSLSIAIILVALIIVILAVINPAKTISKINIIEGIKGNFTEKNKKRKIHQDLWQELRINNMASIKSFRYITTVGTIIISCFLIIIGISIYLKELRFYKSDYNILVEYTTDHHEYPQILKEIIRQIPNEKAYISRNKYFNVEPNLELSSVAKEKGLNQKLKKYLANNGDKAIDGALIGVEESELINLGGKKGEFLLFNQVQEDPNVPLKDAKYVTYLESPKSLIINLSGAKPSKEIKITERISDTGKFEQKPRPFEIQIFTDFETQKLLVENHPKAKEKSSRFALKMKVKPRDLKDDKEYIEKTLKNHLGFNERFTIITGDELSANEANSMKAFTFIVTGIGLIIFLLNITNGYAAIHMSLLSRRQEIACLYSCGMEKKEINQLYLKEFIAEEVKSFGITILISIIVMFGISLGFQNLTMKILLSYFPYLYFGIFLIVIYGGNILMYYLSLLYILKSDSVRLINSKILARY